MEELRQIAGFFVGDGFWLDEKVAFSNTNEDLINHYIKIITDLGFKTSLYRRKKQGNRKDEFTLVVEKKFTENMKYELEEMWLDINREKSKAFLRGFFDAEGTINFASTRRGRKIEVTNTDPDLIRLAQACLKKLDIKSRIRLAGGFRPNRQKCFQLKTFGEESINFVKLVKPYKIWSKGYLEKKVHPKYSYIFK